jgi:hypothetical protein
MAMRGHGAARLHALSGWMSAGSATEGGDERGGAKGRCSFELQLS